MIMPTEQLLLAGMAGCITAIVHLYMRQEKKHAAAAKRLDKCESDREALWKHIAGMAAYTCTDATCTDRRPQPRKDTEE